MSSSTNTHGQGVDAPQHEEHTDTNTTQSNSDSAALPVYHDWHSLECTGENCARWGTPMHTQFILGMLNEWRVLPPEALQLLLDRLGALQPPHPLAGSAETAHISAVLDTMRGIVQACTVGRGSATQAGTPPPLDPRWLAAVVLPTILSLFKACRFIFAILSILGGTIMCSVAGEASTRLPSSVFLSLQKAPLYVRIRTNMYV